MPTPTAASIPDELKRLQKDYADLWGPLSELLKKLSAGEYVGAPG